MKSVGWESDLELSQTGAQSQDDTDHFKAVLPGPIELRREARSLILFTTDVENSDLEDF